MNLQKPQNYFAVVHFYLEISPYCFHFKTQSEADLL